MQVWVAIAAQEEPKPVTTATPRSRPGAWASPRALLIASWKQSWKYPRVGTTARPTIFPSPVATMALTHSVPTSAPATTIVRTSLVPG